MNATTVVLLLAAGMMLASPAALAKEIYTWTDENGVVHYVDKRPDNPEAKAMQAPEAYRPGSVSAQPADPEESSPDGAPGSEAGDSPNQQLSPADARRQELAAAAEQRNAQRAQLNAVCGQARSQLAEIEPNRRVFYENEQGETVRMDDVERVQRVEQLKQIIAENCQ